MKRVLWMKLLSMVVCLLFFMGGYTTTQAGEWNEKPIMCANEVETFEAIGDKKEELIIKWYDYLNKKDIDKAYSVYDDDYYFVDLWDCFKGCSRKYLRDLYKPTLENGKSILELMNDAKHIDDIVCGI